MKDKDIAKVTKGLVQIPMVVRTIAFGYNYDYNLKLSQEQDVQVAIGMIKNWKKVRCKPGKLTWAHRSDGSGTTKAFTNSMEAFSKTWTLGTAKGAYPITSSTWILDYEEGNGRKTKAIQQAFNTLLSDEYQD